MNYELYTTKHWMVLPSFVHGILPALMYNSNNRVVLDLADKKQPYLVAAGSGEVFRDSQVTEDGEMVPRRDGWTGESLLAKMKEPFVNIIPIDGPITRNGDACSYGSKDIRDWMMEAAGNKYCRAHVLVVNTPGGSAWAKNDFQQAIDFAHECGHRVYLLIDGLCASAGMYLASFCDEVYVVNLKDQLGCVGVMSSFFTIKNGEKNQFDSETYHEYYATKSINKNKEYRDIAENDDATLLIADLDKLEDEFRKDMQAAFPNATDDHLDGKVFDASEVMGILCDGQMMLGDLVDRAFAVANGEEQPIARTAGRNIVLPKEEPEDEPDDEPAANATGTVAGTAVATDKNSISPKNSTTMTNKKYQKIAQLLGVDELVVTEEGTFLNAPLLDTLESKLDEMQKANDPAPAQEAQDPAPKAEDPAPAAEDPAPAADPEPEPAPAQEDPAPAADPEPEPEPAPAQEAVEGAKADIGKINETLHSAETMIAEKDKEIASLKESLADEKKKLAAKQTTVDTLTNESENLDEELKEAKATIEENAKTIENLTEQLDAAKAELETAKGGISEKNATIEANVKAIAELKEANDKLTKQVADLKAEVKELSEKPAPMVDAAAGVPAGNGTGEAPKLHEKKITRENMTYEHCRQVAKERQEKK